MTPLIKINMLPYREQLDQKKKSQFNRLMLLAAAAGLGLAIFTYITLSGMTLNQESRNQQLTNGISELDKQIAEVKTLESEKASFLARKQKVEELENKRFEAARMIDTLNAVAPEGVYLTAIQAKSVNTYTLSGKATSDSKIADFMRVIPNTGLFDQPTLDSINKKDNLQEFSLTVTVNNSPAASSASSPPAHTN